MTEHTFVYTHCWYGRGSYDWDFYKCTNCCKEIMLSENTEPAFSKIKETCEEYRAANPISYHQEYDYL